MSAIISFSGNERTNFQQLDELFFRNTNYSLSSFFRNTTIKLVKYWLRFIKWKNLNEWTSKRSIRFSGRIVLKFGTISTSHEANSRSNRSKFEKKNKIEKNTVTWHHLETKNRLRVGNTPFIEHPVWFEQKCKRYREIPYTYSREPISSLSRGVRRLVYESHCANREKSNGVFYQ